MSESPGSSSEKEDDGTKIYEIEGCTVEVKTKIDQEELEKELNDVFHTTRNELIVGTPNVDKGGGDEMICVNGQGVRFRNSTNVNDILSEITHGMVWFSSSKSMSRRTILGLNSRTTSGYPSISTKLNCFG